MPGCPHGLPSGLVPGVKSACVAPLGAPSDCFGCPSLCGGEPASRTGDPTAEPRTPDLSPGGQAAPIYVVDRTDIVRIYVDVPERDANFIHIGSEARVKLWAYRDEWIPATVTRLSWALNIHSRTMRAEIDLPNPNSQILPGMYAYGKVVV